MNRSLIQLGATFMFFGVAFGAFGAHALKDRLTTDQLAIWHTAVQYQLIHGLALLFIALLPIDRLSKLVGNLFAAGILIFSGSLYALAVSGVKILGAITPLGGLCFLGGWLILAIKIGKPQNATE